MQSYENCSSCTMKCMWSLMGRKNFKRGSFQHWFQSSVKKKYKEINIERWRASYKELIEIKTQIMRSNNNYTQAMPGHGGPIWIAGWLAWGQKEGEQAETDGQIDSEGHDWAVSVCGEWGPVGTTWIMAPVERGGDQINNSPEEREEQEREQEDEGLTQEVFITGPPRLPACSPFFFFFISTYTVNVLSKALIHFLCGKKVEREPVRWYPSIAKKKTYMNTGCTKA